VERAAKVAEKERQKAARDAEKAIQLSQIGKCKASKLSSHLESVRNVLLLIHLMY